MRRVIMKKKTASNSLHHRIAMNGDKVLEARVIARTKNKAPSIAHKDFWRIGK